MAIRKIQEIIPYVFTARLEDFPQTFDSNIECFIDSNMKSYPIEPELLQRFSNTPLCIDQRIENSIGNYVFSNIYDHTSM